MKNRVVIGLIIIGIVLIMVSVFVPTRNLDLLASKEIAKITEINSDTPTGVITRGLDQYDDIPAKKGLKIRHLDLIKTAPLSDVLITLTQTGGELRVLENSEILVEQTDDKTTLVTVRSGDVFIERFGQEPSFWVRKEGRQLTAMDYALSNEKNVESLRQKGLKTSLPEDVLPQSKIEEILASKKSDFFRCYGQLIQKTEQAHGQVLISFEISPIGKVTKVEINRSDIQDKSFKACLSEVVARTVFPKFSGSAITTVFPLKFD
ncbi:MAG: AgmX/PglI C-terminal domain-containing protein [Pseudobdellovibrio sp.]|nr:AgmX/PglI C-terminal domain-containing protein [Pseudobdellovibrio sp.]